MRKFLKVFIIISVVIAAVFVAGHFYVKNRLHSTIENDLLTGQVAVEDLNLNLWTGDASATRIRTADSIAEALYFNIDKAAISGLDYFKLLTTDTIQVDKFEAEGYALNLGKDSSKQQSKSSQKVIVINEIALDKGEISNTSGARETAFFKFSKTSIKKVNIPLENILEGLEYQVDQITVDSLFLKLNKRENLHASRLNLYQDSVAVRNLQFVTNDSVQKLVRAGRINYDILDLQVPELTVSNYTLGLMSPSKFTADRIILNQPVLTSWSNANLEKGEPAATYHQLLRDMKLKLDIRKLQINNGTVDYSEPHAELDRRGSITFDQINGSINSFTNFQEQQPIKIDMSSRFMKESTVNVDWTMNVYDPVDTHLIKTDLHNFSLSSMNSFLNPVLNIELHGKVEDYFFTIDARKDNGIVNTQINYSDLKIDFLSEDGDSKWLLSGAANLIAKKNSNDKSINKDATMPRDRRRSIFNFIWKIQEKALRKVIL
ncbi:hypothetical protein BST97_05455 [Nonlabens spongiae]|uniref:DUF748 domain-containing protein n=1 Tax=Nonlabens spongiae TaxID=331648 RepID=A0A1W6MJ08_9FLAO|nr:DUF748 domain-containing protein [Nonlabens spongiae]ARN77476.1 hypothetical protein BST97_05455 [Nonlabens spongiae]